MRLPPVIAALLALLAAGSSAAEVLPPVSQRFSPTRATEETPDLRRHVVPLLAKLGCSAAACHGAQGGQNGFQLSLFGFDYEFDERELSLEGDPPRANWKKPAESDLLLKPALEKDHEGGQLFTRDSWEFRLLQRWIEARAPGVPRAQRAIVLERLEATPTEVRGAVGDPLAQVRVVAVWSDGTREDVTPLCRFETNDEAVATVSPEGELELVGSGDTHLVAFYEQGIATVPVLVPFAAPRPPAALTHPVDALVEAKLAALGLEAAPPCTDEEFLRRVSLDATGSLPTPVEIKAFVASEAMDKRTAKIDELLASDAYARYWSTWLCDLTGNNESLMPEPALYAEQSRQWYRWMYARVRENVPYDQIVAGLVSGLSRLPGESYADYCAAMTRCLAPEGGDIAFAQRPTMPYFWLRSSVNNSENRALTFAHTFLGVQLECAQCHKHPFDRWTKQDFQGLEAFFKGLKYGVARDGTAVRDELAGRIAVPEEKKRDAQGYYMTLAKEGTIAPWRELYYDGQALGISARQQRGADAAELRTPLDVLVAWMGDLDHPYVAMALVNRVWAHHLGTGLVEPVDDLNLAKPPSNLPLFDALVLQFIESGYDLRKLHRTILTSDVYQRSWQPPSGRPTSQLDERNYTHAALRQLPAEVLYDALATATAADPAAAREAGSRIVGPNAGLFRSDSRNRELTKLGKPSRSAVCQRQRKNVANLSLALFVQNDPVVHQMIERPGGWWASLREPLAKAQPYEINATVEEAYLRVLGRWPSDDDLAACRHFMEESPNLHEGLRGVLWALINTKEFGINR